MKAAAYNKRYNRFLGVLKAARLAAQLTQVEAAHALRKPQSYVSKCESGERRVDVVELAEFCRVYKTKSDDFLKAIEDA